MVLKYCICSAFLKRNIMVNVYESAAAIAVVMSLLRSLRSLYVVAVIVARKLQYKNNV
jgi:hypothetical protein